MTEQVKEESSADEVVQRMKFAVDSKGGLFMLDKELSLRVFTPPLTSTDN